MKLMLSLLFIFLSIVGLADAGYITYNELNGVVPPCNVSGFKCESVLSSEWAHIGPLPISVLGLIFYGSIFLLATLHLTEVNLRPLGTRLAQMFGISDKKALAAHPLSWITPLDLLTFMGGMGFLFSLYLVILMAFVIKAWCLYCLISAVNALLLFVFTRVYSQDARSQTPIFTHFFTSSIVAWLYQTIVKRICFLVDAEVVHTSIVSAGWLLGSNPITRFITRSGLGFHSPTLAVRRDGITFANPVGLAAGFDYFASLTDILPEVGFGWHTIGTVTLEPYDGNTPPRLGRYPESQALLVNKGFKSPGARAVINRLSGKSFSIPVGISIGSTNKIFENTKAQLVDILTTFWLFERSNVSHAYYELNISCPNTRGGQPFTTPDRLEILLEALDHITLSRPVYVKMPIDKTDAEALGLLTVIDRHVISGVIFGNLTKDKTNPALVPADSAHWQTASGNVSGKPTWDRSNRLIKLTRKHYPKRFTIVGTGGIFTPEDVATKLALGADLVQLITGMVFKGPQLIGQMSNFLVRTK